MAGRIPQSFINDLLARVDIVDVIEARMTLKKTGKNYSGLCPFHDEKTPSFSVSPDKQFYHCFGCQESGTALTFIMNYDRLEFVEAVESLAQSLGLDVPREQTSRGGPPRDRDEEEGLYEVLARAERFYRQSLRDAPAAIEYLKGRGLTGEAARDFGIGFAPPGWQNLADALPGVNAQTLITAGLQIKNEQGRIYDRFRDRIMFPIRDTRGRVIGFGGRTMSSDDGPKYLNSPETPVFHKGSELYGLYEARRALRRIDRLILVEGYMDVVALAQHGVPNAVAALGTASGEGHFHKLFRYADEVVCCFDGDQAGRSAAWKALENALPTLNEHRQLKLVFLPDGEDPDSLIRQRGKSGFDECVASAVPGLEFLFQRLGEGLNLESVDGRARMAGLLGPYIEKVPPGVLRTLLEQKLADVTGLGRPHGATPRHSRQTRRETNALGKITSRLLALLMKAPHNWQATPSEARARILAQSGELGVLGRVFDYLEGHPEADSEELLIHWSGEAEHADLLQAAHAPLEIGRDHIAADFAGGIERLLAQLNAQSRKHAIGQLQEGQDIDELRNYWRMRQSKTE